MTLQNFEQSLSQALNVWYPPTEAANIARFFVLETLAIPRHKRVTHQNTPLSDSQLTALAAGAERLKKGEPLQYVLGSVVFYGHRLAIGPGALIPRPETEELVDKIVQHYRKSGASPGRVLEVGTGSGCIALSLAVALSPTPDGLLAQDVSEAALAWARRNHRQLVEENPQAAGLSAIRWHRSDIIQPDTWPALLAHFSGSQVDLIVSNPPYIPQAEAVELAPHVLEFEPATALFDPHAADGLSFYRILLELGRQYLAPRGLLALELHSPTARQVGELATQAGYTQVKVLQDLFGHPRFLWTSL